MPFIIVSGLSGSGKSTVLHSLEDAGYFAADNLPPELWSAMADLAVARRIERVVVSTDARTRDFLAALEPSYERLKRREEDVRVVFLEATDEVLLRRYNLSRRAHPLGEPSLMLDFQREGELLAPLRAIADTVIDTTALTSAQLGERILGLVGVAQGFDLRLTTFGFKHTPPRDVDLMLDVRTLPNPYYDPELRARTGLEAVVAAHVFSGDESEAFYAHLRGFVRESAERARAAGRQSYSVAIGCTGGQHRSVAVAERLKRDLLDLGARVIDHRDIPLDPPPEPPDHQGTGPRRTGRRSPPGAPVRAPPERPQPGPARPGGGRAGSEPEDSGASDSGASDFRASGSQTSGEADQGRRLSPPSGVQGTPEHRSLARLRRGQRSLSRASRWLTPGLGIKRWISLFALCSLVGAFAFLHLTWTGPLHFAATHWILYLNTLTDPQVVPLWVVGGAVTLLALAGALTSMVMFNRSILRASGHDPRATLDSIHSVRTLARGPRVLAVGGGTGLSKLLGGLKDYSGNLTAVVTVADDGGSSGRLRRALDMIAPGDLTDCYAALSDSPVLARLLLHRFERGDGLSGHTFGNLLLATLSEEQGGLQGAMQDVHEVLKVRGEVFPATTSPTALVAELSDGRTVRGESRLASQKGEARIVQVRLDPPDLPALPAVLEAVRLASLIVLGPGSLYTSILPALLVPEVAEAVRQSKAPLVYVAPIMTEPGETDGMPLAAHDAAIFGHLGRRPDLLLVNNLPVPMHVQARYAAEDAVPLGSLGLDAQTRRRVVYAALLQPGLVAHHDPAALARALIALKRRPKA